MAEQSNFPQPRHDASHHQLPIEAVKIHLDVAMDTMKKNEGINEDDWAWFDGYLKVMKEWVVVAYSEWKKTKFMALCNQYLEHVHPDGFKRD